MDKLKLAIQSLETHINYGSVIGSKDIVMSAMEADNILDLLKEQEDVKPFHKCFGNEYTLIEDSSFDYCPYCGKKVKWE